MQKPSPSPSPSQSQSTSPPSSPSPTEPPSQVSFVEAFWFWLKLGFISFGGPAGQIAVLHQELVERRRWLSEKRFLHALNYCMLLPGPEAQQLVTYIGWLLHKRWGGIVAGVLFVLPSLLILIALSWVYIRFHDALWLSGLFYGIKPAVTAIVVQAVHRIGSRALKNASLWAIAAAAFVAIFAIELPFPLIIALAAAIGFVGGRISPSTFQTGGGHAAKQTTSGAALIDDHTPTPDHARFSWRGLMQVLVVGLLLWVVPMGVLCALFGWQHDYAQMAWFFTKAALLTFGGAYAVLPYVYQGAVRMRCFPMCTKVRCRNLRGSHPHKCWTVWPWVKPRLAHSSWWWHLWVSLAAMSKRCSAPTVCFWRVHWLRVWSLGSPFCHRSFLFWRVGLWWRAPTKT